MKETKVIVCSNEKTFLKSLKDADTVFVWHFKQEWLKLAPKLNLIVTPAAGREFIQIDLPAGIKIEHSCFHGRLIGETVLGMILANSRGILASYQFQNTKAWPRQELDKQMRLLQGSQVTILGFGNLGSQVGRLAKPFGPHICGIKRAAAASPDYFDKDDLILPLKELDSVLPQTDHLVLCLPASEETTNIINESRLKLLPSHASIYNVGRGNSIDENSLITALSSNNLRAAYLDVFKEEPLPITSPLRTCPNCFIMPHASVFCPNFMDYFIDEFLIKHVKS
ncbi:MAG: hydroxyacid dehydrogenase [Spirochaetales bacterium]|nr:hydroxyacid dehydrogenase [Spirochaetales bacterium]